MNIYVGNLSWGMNDQDLENLFAEHGTVTSAKIITDRMTNRSRGFGFVEMSDGAENCLLYTSPSPRDRTRSRMPSSA